MCNVAKSLLVAVSAMTFVVAGNAAYAASNVFEGGGVLQEGFDALQQELVRSHEQDGGPKLKVLDRKTSIVGFTPRFSGVPIELADGVSVDRGLLLKTRFAGTSSAVNPGNRALQLAQTHDLGLVKVDLSAIAGFSAQGDRDDGQSSSFGFGGGLKFDSLGGFRLDASYNRRDESVGVASDSVTAGLGYDFGALDTRLTVSNVAQYDVNGVAADEQKVWAVGGQMTLSSSFVVGGDLAYSTNLDGTADTSGVVNFRFNF